MLTLLVRYCLTANATLRSAGNKVSIVLFPSNHFVFPGNHCMFPSNQYLSLINRGENALLLILQTQDVYSTPVI